MNANPDEIAPDEPSVDELREVSSPWNWPAEWAVDEKFWREVATRTIAGILTLALLGFPGLVYAMTTGVLTAGQAIPIIIGAGSILVIIGAYAIVQVISRGVAKKAIIDALKKSGPSSFTAITTPWGSALFATKLIRASSEERKNLVVQFNLGLQEQLLFTIKRQAAVSIFAGVAAFIAGLIVPIIPLLK